jgi:hypothetical protein
MSCALLKAVILQIQIYRTHVLLSVNSQLKAIKKAS